jgi:hypothetical protein
VKIDGMKIFRLDSMRMLKRGIVVVLIILYTTVASADEPDSVAREEISHLFSHLASSGCQFYRNGSWHSSSRAVSHLHQKYEYLLKRRQMSTAESFITLGATASSTSGNHYLVKCGDAPAVESAAWFTQELARYRAATK